TSFLVALLCPAPRLAGQSPTDGNGPGNGNDVSLLVFSVEAPLLAGADVRNRIASLCEALLQEPAEAAGPSLLAQLAASGGMYRILSHRQLVQCGIFFPQSFPNVRGWVQTFIAKLQQRWSILPAETGPVSLDDQVYRRLMCERWPRESSQAVSIYVEGALREGEEELMRQIQRLAVPANSASSTAPDQFVIASMPPSLICLAEWEGPEAEALARAQFASELVGRAGLPPGVRREVLAFPGRAFLEVIATSTLQNVGDFQALAEEVGRVVNRQDMQDTWREFAALRRQLLQHDRRDFFKGAFINAWEKHFQTSIFEFPASCTWVPPLTFRHWLCLPSEQMHRFMCEVTRKPSVVACRLASGTGVEVAIQISRQTGKAPGATSLRSGLAAFEDLGLSVTVLSDADFLIQAHVEHDQVANLLATVRAVFLEQFLRSEAAGAVKGGQPDLQTDWDVYIAAVGPFPPYMLINSLRKGWPSFGDQNQKIGDPLQMLAAALDIASAAPDLVKGRWQLATSSVYSLTRTLVRYVAKGGSVRELIPLVGPF
ncbi:MAG TPA: hypothetical protein PKO06_10030, partial [Candidatus Ozemobacteraceae bacterium]|nr:hypothetical protein [Candidatus Ozemobacteraceae bacterium]